MTTLGTAATGLPLSPTTRTRLNRSKERGADDRADLRAVLREALICHLGFNTPHGPVVLPTCFATDPMGPDEGGTLYVHGSVATRSLTGTDGQQVCVTVTLLDGLVLARSAFHHSMNYRSAVILGAARKVGDPAEREHALALLMEQIVPGRWATMRPHTRRELAATAVLAVPLAEASVKSRTGGPHDDQADIDAGVWAGVLPLRLTAGQVAPAADAMGEPPAHVQTRARHLGPVRG